MSNSQTHSYFELVNSKSFWIESRVSEATLNDTVNGLLPLSSSLVFKCNKINVEEGAVFPFNEIRIEAVEESLEFWEKNQHYPFGHIELHDSSPSITLRCRSDLITRMISMINLIQNGSVEFLISLPVIPSPKPHLLPVLEYQFRAYSSKNV